MPSNLETDKNGQVKRGPGRPKGTPNKVGKAAKELIAEAADALGGLQRLVEWCQEDTANERAFWSSIYPKLLPLQVNADVNATITKVERAIVRPANTNG